MSNLKFVEINNENKFAAQILLAEYGHYLVVELGFKASIDLFFLELEELATGKSKTSIGAFFIIYDDKSIIGCVCLKRFDAASCELKRMYIREAHRGKGLAKTIIEFMLGIACSRGYEKVLLNTNRAMASAITAYINTGFREIPPYCENENDSPVFLAYYLKVN